MTLLRTPLDPAGKGGRAVEEGAAGSRGSASLSPSPFLLSLRYLPLFQGGPDSLPMASDSFFLKFNVSSLGYNHLPSFGAYLLKWWSLEFCLADYPTRSCFSVSYQTQCTWFIWRMLKTVLVKLQRPTACLGVGRAKEINANWENRFVCATEWIYYTHDVFL